MSSYAKLPSRPSFVLYSTDKVFASFRRSGDNDPSRGHGDGRAAAGRRHVRGDVVIVHVGAAAGFGFVARTRQGAGLVADQGRLARHGRRGTETLAAVFDANVAVGGGGLGRQPGLGGGDAQFDGHGVVGGDQGHGVVVEGFGVAARVDKPLGWSGGGGGRGATCGAGCGGDGRRVRGG